VTVRARRTGKRGIWRRPPGLTVALLAPDGGGKTTLAKALERSLPAPAKRVYMGLFRQSGHIWEVPVAGLSLRLFLAWRSYLVGLLYRTTGHIVIYDRYCFDAFLLPGPTRLHRLDRWLLGHSCPAPDLTLILDVPGSALHARKQESAPALLETERQAYLRLSDIIPRASVVDGAVPFDDVHRQVAALIEGEYTRRRADRS
jgi:thymidylate kinase